MPNGLGKATFLGAPVYVCGQGFSFTMPHARWGYYIVVVFEKVL